MQAKINSFRMSSNTLPEFLESQKITPERRRKFLEVRGTTLPGDLLYMFEFLGISILVDEDVSDGQIITNITDESGATYDLTA